MFKALSRAPRRLPLPILRRRRPLLASLLASCGARRMIARWMRLVSGRRSYLRHARPGA